MWTLVFTAWPALVLIAFDFALLYPIIAIGAAAVFVLVWRGMALLVPALGTALCFAGIWGLVLLAEHNGEPSGSLQLMPVSWTWLVSVLYLLFGIALIFVWATRLRGQRVR